MNKDKTRPAGSSFKPARANDITNGFTLIEMVLVLTLTSTVLGGTIGLMSLARRSNQQANQNLLQRREIRRLTDDIRRDIRLAESSTVADGELVLSNTSLDWEIVYSVESNSSVGRRVEKMTEPAVQRDNYAIGVSARIDVQWLDEFNAVQWTITETDSPNEPIQIIASRRLTE